MNLNQREALLTHLTASVLFSPDRSVTKEFLSEVVHKANLDKNDADILNGVEIVAPAHGEFQTVLPIRNTPTCILYPAIEKTETKEAAEEAIAECLARAIVMVRGTPQNQTERETDTLLRAWNVEAKAALPARATA
jgi:hypothetical protein